MSDLWDYDDDDDLSDGGDWSVPSPDVVVEMEDDTFRAKRRAGRKAGEAAGKRRAASPAASLALQPVPIPTTILLDSDEDDDLVLLPSPVPNPNRNGTAGAAGVAGQNVEPSAAPSAARPVVSNLNLATQQSLAREQELLRALQQVTERDDEQDDDLDACPTPSVTRLTHLGLSRLTNRLPLAAAASRAVVNDGAAHYSDDDVVVAAEVHPPGAVSLTHMGPGAQEPAADVAQDQGAGTSAVEETPAPAVDRVQLRLVWGPGKDQSVRMRVVKTDPFVRMVERFRQIATERSLCCDPSKIKFLFDGDDLAKMPHETPKSLDMDDDMMVDVKL